MTMTTTQQQQHWYITVYKVPSGYFPYFLSALRAILSKIYAKSINILLCGDININYLDIMGSNKLKLDSLLASCHLCGTADFPTRVTSTLATAIDNFFIDKHRNKIFSITSLPNGLLDHDAQIIILNNILSLNLSNVPVIRRVINECTIIDLVCVLATNLGLMFST
jgi:hypothetical protein